MSDETITSIKKAIAGIAYDVCVARGRAQACGDQKEQDILLGKMEGLLEARNIINSHCPYHVLKDDVPTANDAWQLNHEQGSDRNGRPTD